MMRACGGRLWLSLASSQGRQKKLTEPRWLHHFPCAWEGWDCFRQVGVPGKPYWASWADAIPMISQRNPTVPNSVVESLNGDAAPHEDCLAQLHACGQTLDREGFRWRN